MVSDRAVFFAEADAKRIADVLVLYVSCLLYVV